MKCSKSKQEQIRKHKNTKLSKHKVPEEKMILKNSSRKNHNIELHNEEKESSFNLFY